MSVRIGTVGVVTLLTASSVMVLSVYGILEASGLFAELVVSMVLGIVLLAVAFLLVRPSVAALLQGPEP
jgi:hypothetical protein